MSTPADSGRPPVAALVLMSLVLLWSGGLAVAFGWAAVVGADQMSYGRTVMFWLIAAFLGLLSVRTGYELVRRLLRRS